MLVLLLGVLVVACVLVVLIIFVQLLLVQQQGMRLRVLLVVELFNKGFEQDSQDVAVPCAEPLQHACKVCLRL
jgi:hypothetical protein